MAIVASDAAVLVGENETEASVRPNVTSLLLLLLLPTQCEPRSLVFSVEASICDGEKTEFSLSISTCASSSLPLPPPTSSLSLTLCCVRFHKVFQ